MRMTRLLLPLLGSVLLTNACVPLAITAGTEAAVIGAQERPVGEAVDDATIFLKLKNAYAQQKDDNDLFANVEVKVVEGRVLLTGNVDKPDSQIEAVRIAWTIPGVREVMNEIQINDKSGFWNYTRDVWISTQIRSRLLVSKGIRSVNYSVITVNQTVYIMGIAQNQEELDKVTYVASVTQYVQQVTSYVRLKTDSRRPAPAQPQG